MKRITFSLTSLGMLFGSIAYGDEPTMHTTASVAQRDPHHFYFGPEFLCYQLNTHIDGIHVQGTRFFFGSRIGYEYLKPNAFYGGIDLFSASTLTDFRASQEGHSVSWHKADRGFGNVEFRLGYTFAPTRWMATPFLGLGVYSVYPIDHHNTQGFKQNLPYVTLGLRSTYAFNPTFSLGLNLKVLRTFEAEQHMHVEHRHVGGRAVTHPNIWGGEIGVPFVWHVGSTKRWDIHCEPYFLKLDFSEVQNVYGTRVLFGFRF